MRQSHLVRVPCCTITQWKKWKGKSGCGREKARGSLTSELLRSLLVLLTACHLFRVLPFLKASAMWIRFHHERLMGTNHIKITDKLYSQRRLPRGIGQAHVNGFTFVLTRDAPMRGWLWSSSGEWMLNIVREKREGQAKTHHWSQTRMRSMGGQPGTDWIHRGAHCD